MIPFWRSPGKPAGSFPRPVQRRDGSIRINRPGRAAASMRQRYLKGQQTVHCVRSSVSCRLRTPDDWRCRVHQVRQRSQPSDQVSWSPHRCRIPEYSRLYKCVSKCLMIFLKIVMGLPFGVTGLRMSPDPALCVENELSYSVYVVYDQLLSVSHGNTS